jgi:hypothetical protein
MASTPQERIAALRAAVESRSLLHAQDALWNARHWLLDVATEAVAHHRFQMDGQVACGCAICRAVEARP